MRKGMKRSDGRGTAETVPSPIETTGEVFDNSSTIELIRDARSGDALPMLWDGAQETIGSAAEYQRQLYKPARINSGVLRALTLPTRCLAHGATREFLGEICKLISSFSGLPEKAASLAARIVLCTSLVDALRLAPALIFTGPDRGAGDQLLALLGCLCFHALPLTGVTPVGFRSLAGGPRHTYVISQPSLSPPLARLLDDVSSRDAKIPSRGGLLDLFGVQIIHCDSVPCGDSWPLRSIEVSAIPTGTELPDLSLEMRHKITEEFQPKLLGFRRANLGAARQVKFGPSSLASEVRDLARSLAAATPDDATLQAEVFDLLGEEDAQARDQPWIGLEGASIESVLVACSESPGGSRYVSELAEVAQVLLRTRRGEEEFAIDPGAFGKVLKQLGFVTEPRDARGKKLNLTEAVRARALRLARDLGVPEAEGGEPVVSGGFSEGKQ